MAIHNENLNSEIFLIFEKETADGRSTVGQPCREKLGQATENL